MNQKDLNYVRNELRWALRDLSGGTKGQLEALSEHPPADKMTVPRLCANLVELEGEHGSRYVKSQTAPLYVIETRSRRRPMPPINDNEFSSAPWRRAVNALNDYQQSWMRYCYGFDLSYKHQVMMCKYVWESYQECLLDSRLQSRVVKKLISLVWLAGQEVAAALSNETYKDYAGAALARLLSVDRSTWMRVYAIHWANFKAAFSELDRVALLKLLKNFDEHAHSQKLKFE
ncbi:bacteriophage antitermination protein Q [Lelliottia amnigena]|uniref:bacteriophage antitermination protein Q n=1 Tax=Lelliottia amnigena TaxID=61646 RepID=UPI00192AF9AF|nr:bacteriophage antitermination protein Q [Lelliottia amnigena]MBL5932280.1 antitermination protein [Lelliottia amnigena]